jgi:hypothetical protein
MSFDQRFQITGRIAGASGQTDHALAAREISTGRSVTIHLLAGGHSAPNEALLAEIGTLPPEYQVCFLETGDQNGTPYVVTDAITGNPPLRPVDDRAEVQNRGRKGGASEGRDGGTGLERSAARWSGAGGAANQHSGTCASGAAAPPRPVPVSPGGPDADEFSRLLAKLDPPKTPAAPPVPPPSSPAAEPGEFTRLLRAQSPAASAPAPPPPPVAAAPPAAEGEFTRLLRAQSPAAPAPAPPQPPMAAAPPAAEGEFTRLLRAQSPAAPLRRRPRRLWPPHRRQLKRANSRDSCGRNRRPLRRRPRRVWPPHRRPPSRGNLRGSCGPSRHPPLRRRPRRLWPPRRQPPSRVNLRDSCGPSPPPAARRRAATPAEFTSAPVAPPPFDPRRARQRRQFKVQPPPPSPVAPPQSAPGEFTRLLQAQPPAPAQAPALLRPPRGRENLRACSSRSRRRRLRRRQAFPQRVVVRRCRQSSPASSLACCNRRWLRRQAPRSRRRCFRRPCPGAFHCPRRANRVNLRRCCSRPACLPQAGRRARRSRCFRRRRRAA